MQGAGKLAPSCVQAWHRFHLLFTVEDFNRCTITKSLHDGLILCMVRLYDQKQGETLAPPAWSVREAGSADLPPKTTLADRTQDAPYPSRVSGRKEIQSSHTYCWSS